MSFNISGERNSRIENRIAFLEEQAGRLNKKNESLKKDSETAHINDFEKNHCCQKKEANGDKTIAERIQAKLEKLQTKAKELKEKLASFSKESTSPEETTVAPTTPNEDCTSTGETESAPATESSATEPAKTEVRDLKHDEGFSWKPRGGKDKKLQIQLPEFHQGNVGKVKILDADGKELAVGKRSSKSGEAPTFQFDKAGSEFPAGATVVIEFKDGRTRKVTIPDTAKAYEIEKKEQDKDK